MLRAAFLLEEVKPVSFVLDFAVRVLAGSLQSKGQDTSDDFRHLQDLAGLHFHAVAILLLNKWASSSLSFFALQLLKSGRGRLGHFELLRLVHTAGSHLVQDCLLFGQSQEVCNLVATFVGQLLEGWCCLRTLLFQNLGDCFLAEL